VFESPYRAAISQVELEAPTEDGPVLLRVEPQHSILELGGQTWTVGNDHLTVVQAPKKEGGRPKKKSLRLRKARLFVARAWPTPDVGLWVERRPRVVERLVGLRPIAGMSEETVKAWRKLDRLAAELSRALSGHAEGVQSAVELGKGQHRVVAVRMEESIQLYARPVFREKPRRIIEVHSDGTLEVPRRGGIRRIDMSKGVEIIASGDRLQFCRPDGEDVAGLFLPWIGRADREELVRRFQLLLGHEEKTRQATPNPWAAVLEENKTPAPSMS
jgi:hypothetical protein